MSNIYYELDEHEIKTIKEVAYLCFTDYDVENNLIKVDNLSTALSDLLYEYNRMLEEFDDYKKNVKENYERKEFDPYDEYGVSENDF